MAALLQVVVVVMVAVQLVQEAEGHTQRKHRRKLDENRVMEIGDSEEGEEKCRERGSKWASRTALVHQMNSVLLLRI